MKLRQWFWGLFFLLGGALILVNQLGYLGDINIVTLVFTILLIPIILISIRHLNFGGILFPLAVIGILFAKPLGITAITPWPILLFALFASIGLTIIFHSHKKQWFCGVDHHNEHFDTVINQEDEETVEVHVRFGSSIKYVNSKNFKKGNFSASFGALKVYFDNAKVGKDGAEIYLDASFSGVELYIPKNWQVKNCMTANMGGVDEKNYHAPDGPVVTIKGNVSLSGVEIIYI